MPCVFVHSAFMATVLEAYLGAVAAAGFVLLGLLF
jgi:hypothetical protein